MNFYEKYLNSISKSKNVFILTAENRLALRGISEKKILDVGICEQNLVGIASGIAKKGGKCFVHALSNFLVSRAYEFIKINLDYNKNSCVLVGAMGGFLSTFNGPTHQSVDEIYSIGNFKNFDVFFPACLWAPFVLRMLTAHEPLAPGAGRPSAAGRIGSRLARTRN